MTIDLPDDPRWAQVARKLDPRATLLRAWPLQGGISAQMTALALQLPDGETRKVIARRPGAQALQHNPHAAADEFQVLQIVQAAHVAAQTPYFLDQSGEIFPEPFLVVAYIEGDPDFAPARGQAIARQMAAQLARIHQVTTATLDLSFLPRQADRLAQVITQRPARLDDSLDEGRIRAVLEAAWPLPAPDDAVLLHGDFWPGNLLWRDGRLAAVIDWEDAEVGNPLYDLAVSRLDILWIYGSDAMHEFTRRYQSLARVGSAQLPYWDLVAALRPASRLSAWAEGWPAWGRPDITEQTMRARHRWFVTQAFEALATR